MVRDATRQGKGWLVLQVGWDFQALVESFQALSCNKCYPWLAGTPLPSSFSYVIPP